MASTLSQVFHRRLTWATALASMPDAAGSRAEQRRRGAEEGEGRWSGLPRVAGGRGRPGARFRRRSGLAEAAAQQLDHRRRRRHHRRQARSHLGLPPSTVAQFDRQRRAGRRRQERSGQCRSARSGSGARTARCLDAASPRRRCSSSTRMAPSMQAWGGPGDPGFLEKQVPRPGWLHLAGARARHLRRPQRLRLRVRQRPGPRLPRPVSLGGELRQRLARAEVHARRHVRLSDRHARDEGTEQQRHEAAASTARRSRIWSRT